MQGRAAIAAGDRFPECYRFAGLVQNEVLAMSASHVQEIVTSLRRILAHVTGDSSGVWMGLDVTIPQMKVLMLLREHGAMRVGVVAHDIGVSTPTITGIIDWLVRQELVTREGDPTDRRVVLNLLTPTGEELTERLRHRSDEELNRLVSAVSREERETIAQSLKRLDQILAATPQA